jgi:hypothetical protein
MGRNKANYVWYDCNFKGYTLQDIDDRYLLNILNFISRGGGHADLMSENNIKKLFNEANKRKLKHNHTLEQLKEAYRDKLSYECQVVEDWWNYIDYE